VKATSTRRLVDEPALAWSQRLEVEVGGAGTVAAAGVVLPRLLADRLGLTNGLAQVVARAGFFPVRHRGRALVDATCAPAAGATCLSDVEAMTAQEEIYGPGGGASDSTMLRALDELAERLGGDGLPGRRLARATAAARARAWAAIVARRGQLPAVRVAGTDLTRPATEPGGSPRPVLVIRPGATLIEAASPKAQAAGTYKGGFGFHPLTGWWANIGDALAVMGRPGNAGSFTAADHLAVLTASFAQIPAGWRTDVLVTRRRRGCLPRRHRPPHLVEHRARARQARPAGGVHHRLAGRRTDRGRDRATAQQRLGRGRGHRRRPRPRRAGRGPDRDHAAPPGRRPAGDLAGRHAHHHPAHPAAGDQAGQARGAPGLGVRRIRPPSPPAGRSSSSTPATAPRPTSRTG